MTTLTQDQIVALIRLPLTCKERQDKSMIALFREIGFDDNISPDAIQQALEAHPGCVDAWYLNSMNQRSPFAWYFTEHTKRATIYFVGFVDSQTENREERRFRNRCEACAVYVLHELKMLASL